VGGQLHLAESALADGLAQQVAADPASFLVRWLSHLLINIIKIRPPLPFPPTEIFSLD
jgi:hypothetical protein